MARDYVAVPYEYAEEMAELTDEEFGQLIRALIRYGRLREPISLTSNARFYANRVMAREDAYRQNYIKRCETNRQNGERGGRPPKGTEENPQKPKETESNPTITEKTKDEYKYEYKYKDKYEYEVSKDTSSEEEADRCPYQKIMDMYNSICKSLSSIRQMSENRKKAVRARWKTYQTLSVFEELFKDAESSDFLTGKNDRGWKANFDWLMNEQNMTKVLELRYQNVGKPVPSQTHSFDLDEFDNWSLRREVKS